MILWIFPKIVKLYSKTLADNRYISIIYTNLDKLSNKITDTVQMQVKVILGIMVWKTDLWMSITGYCTNK